DRGRGRLFRRVAARRHSAQRPRDAYSGRLRWGRRGRRGL
ncbi:MAG: Phosphate starvation-inducible protein PhoH, predicted ATPase, partial [uncultured Rubrobacteraceae bacterium]